MRLSLVHVGCQVYFFDSTVLDVRPNTESQSFFLSGLWAGRGTKADNNDEVHNLVALSGPKRNGGHVLAHQNVQRTEIVLEHQE